jgi:hypothetical protein
MGSWCDTLNTVPLTCRRPTWVTIFRPECGGMAVVHTVFAVQGLVPERLADVLRSLCASNSGVFRKKQF